MPCQRTQQCVASGALVVELAGIGRHGLDLCMAALGAGDGRLELNVGHGAGVRPPLTPRAGSTSGPMMAAPTAAQRCLPKLTMRVGYTLYLGTESTMESAEYTIGRLAKEGGVSVETVRYYQRRRLLAVPARRAGGFRYYGAETLERLRFIRRAQAIGLALEDVRELLGLDRKRACGTTRALAAQRLQLIERKLKDLTVLRDALAGLVHECDERGGPTCPILTRLSGGSEAGIPARLEKSARVPGARGRDRRVRSAW